MKAREFLESIQAQVRALEASLEGAPREHVVEVGYTLANLISTASQALEPIKTRLREEAVKDLSHQAGSISFEGSGLGMVTVTVPKPQLKLSKGVDINQLKLTLAEDFDTYFDTKVVYTPRKTIVPLVVKLASGDKKTTLLSSIEEREPTPRVSFKKP